MISSVIVSCFRSTMYQEELLRFPEESSLRMIMPASMSIRERRLFSEKVSTFSDSTRLKEQSPKKDLLILSRGNLTSLPSINMG